MLGAGWHHIDVVNGRRQGVLVSYLESALDRPNLTLRADAQAIELLWRSDHCAGLRYVQAAAVTPNGPGRRLLLLSGLGPQRQLAGLGIRVVADLPGVRENFHNHVLAGVIAETRRPVKPGRQNLSEAALFATSQPGLIAPDLRSRSSMCLSTLSSGATTRTR